MKRYEIIKSKVWVHTSGLQASIYGACPWYNDAEEADWELVVKGWTIRDNVMNRVGFGKSPFKTLAEAKELQMKLIELSSV